MAFQALRAVAGLYKGLLLLRRKAYQKGYLRTTSLPVPVLVVGNVVAGGAGKTPTVVALLEHFVQQGWRVGVISRGYGRSTRDCRLVHALSQAQEVGDEPLLVYHRCQVPVAVASQRVQAAKALLSAHPETQLLISDDGLQHLALSRDFEILVFDDRGIGNGELLPAGWLREPWPRRADWVLHTGAHPAEVGVKAFTGRRTLETLVRNGEGQTRPLQDFAHLSVAALAGIAHPERFFEMLRAQGIALVATQSLPDHADLRQWQAPESWSQRSGLEVLCTEKDAHKLWGQHPEIWSVRLRFEPEAKFFQQLDRALAPLIRPQAKAPHAR